MPELSPELSGASTPAGREQLAQFEIDAAIEAETIAVRHAVQV